MTIKLSPRSDSPAQKQTAPKRADKKPSAPIRSTKSTTPKPSHSLKEKKKDSVPISAKAKVRSNKNQTSPGVKPQKLNPLAQSAANELLKPSEKPAQQKIQNFSKDYIFHIAPDFFPVWANHSKQVGLEKTTDLGDNFFICKYKNILEKEDEVTQILSRFQMPIHFMWPVKSTSQDFIERASQGILKAFASNAFYNIQIFSTQPGLQLLSKNLRGRILQLALPALQKSSQSKFQIWRQDPLLSPPQKPTLYICINANCVYAGLATPAFAGSFFAGGRRFIKNSEVDSVSRAGAKAVEALEHLQVLNVKTDSLQHWLELGASPGGMTRELLAREKNVVAVDKAPLSPDLQFAEGLKYVRADVRDFTTTQLFDAILCDMNGPSSISAHAVASLAKNLKKDGVAIFTLKSATPSSILQSHQQAVQTFLSRGLHLLGAKHLFHNRQEITLFLRKS